MGNDLHRSIGPHNDVQVRGSKEGVGVYSQTAACDGDASCERHDTCYSEGGLPADDVSVFDPGQDPGPSDQDVRDDRLASESALAPVTGPWDCLVKAGIGLLFGDPQ